MTAPLTVYKASAGSGKTFRLAVEYIKHLIRDPQAYRQILAVTFTNKATEEMKMRILSQLYGIWKGLPGSEACRDTVCRELDASPQWVAERAGTALTLLLHHYSHFHIETIDSFFQTVLRNLARELDLPPNLTVGLNDRQVMETAVDRLIEQLDPESDVLRWIMDFVNENIRDDKSWDIIQQVKDFGQTLFKDFYKRESDRLNECLARQGFFNSYVRTLKAVQAEARKTMTDLADEFFQTISQAGLDIADFSNGNSGPCSIFIKIRRGEMGGNIVGKRVADACLDSAKWAARKHPRREEIIRLAESSLMPLINRTVRQQPVQWRAFQSATLSLRHLHQLRLLSSIEDKVRQLNEEANRFLLSDTQPLLHSLIDGSDSPFIFEKIGTHIEHIMIDEFQDTSNIQWSNFKVLLDECMSHAGADNLIVGDVKQSIYRWRSGDWRLLNDIDAAFAPRRDAVDVRPLAVNYRSATRIIRFNNTLFSHISRNECQDIAADNPEGARQMEKAYADVCQQIPQGREEDGHVCVELLPATDYEERMMGEVADTVERLISMGESQSGIAILVRYNYLIPDIAKSLMQRLPDVNVVSDEAFRLDASLAVNVMVKAMALLAHPDDRLAMADVAKAYQSVILDTRAPLDNWLKAGSDMESLLPQEFTDRRQELREMPLPDLVEELYRIFSLQLLADECNYVCAFHDAVAQFMNNMATEIDDFVKEWDENLCSTTIQSQGQAGIRILSIHKSKGLEFDNVIIPFCDWQMERSRGNVIWCTPTEEPYSRLPLVPVSYSAKALQGTIYEPDYRLEHLQTTVDNLNLLYVALTRAGRRLYVFGRLDAPATRSASLQEAMPDVVRQLGGEAEEHQTGDLLRYTYGQEATRNGNHAPSTQKEAQKDTQKESRKEAQKDARKTAPSDDASPKESSPAPQNVFTQAATEERICIECHDSHVEYRQSNKSRNFVEGQEGDTQSDTYISLGSLLHGVLQSIATREDIPARLAQLEMEGVLGEGSITAGRLRQLLQRSMDDSRVASWFDGTWTLHNECTIVDICPETGELRERRPDRVMSKDGEVVVVDYKFGTPKPEYAAQVEEYKQLLMRMGRPCVKGYLWYVYTGRIEEV